MLAVYRKHFTLVGILVLVTMVPQALLQYSLLDMGRIGTGPVGVVGAPFDIEISIDPHRAG